MSGKGRQEDSLDSESTEPLDNNKPHSKSKGPPWWRSCRYLLAMMQFLGMTILFFQRNHFSVAIVCMVNHTAVDIRYRGLGDAPHVSENLSLATTGGTFSENVSYSALSSTATSTATPSCHALAEERKEDGPYVWSRDVQGVLLGAMFWSYMALQLPGAILAERFLSVKTTTTAAVAAMSLIHLFVPLLAEVSPWTVLMARILVGLFVGLFVVAFYNVWSKWAPPDERSRLIAIASAGNQLGNTCVFPLSALLCRTPLGWPSIFYTFSCMGLVWCVLSLVLVYESPDVHPRISPEERDYIVSAIANSTSKQRKDDVPWRKILTSVPLWSITMALFSFNWANFQMTSTLPIFMREVLKFDIKSNGMFSMLPFLAAWAVMYISGFISDTLIQRRLLSIARTRKVIQSVGHVTGAVCLVAVSFLDCTQKGAAVLLLTLSVGMSAVCITTLPVNIFDVAPKYFSVCYAFCNTVAVMPGFLAPILVAELTKEKTREQWQITFFVTAAIMVAGSLIFVTFGQGHPLSWATGEKTTVTVEDRASTTKHSENGNLCDGHTDHKDAVL